MEKLCRPPDYENSNPIPNIRAVKSCQLQSIFHFCNIVFLNLCKRVTNTIILLVFLTSKHFVVIVSVA